MQRPVTQKGFSLIEMLVSIALFAVVVTTGVGTLLTMINANARAQSIQIATNNLYFAVDVIARQLRVGSSYYCGNNINAITSGANLASGSRDCNNAGNTAVAFTDTRTGDRYGFALEAGGTKIMRKINNGPWEPLTSDVVRITELDFVVTGSGNGTTDQPTVTFYITAEVGNTEEDSTSFEIQSSVTQRSLKL